MPLAKVSSYFANGQSRFSAAKIGIIFESAISERKNLSAICVPAFNIYCRTGSQDQSIAHRTPI